VDKLKKINIQTIKKILSRRGYKVSKKNESFFSVYYTTIASVSLILIFYLIPFVVSVTSKVFKKNEVVINSSNQNFNRVLEGKEIQLDKNNENEEVNYKELFLDIFDFEINEKDTVRLSASTINQLFKDENYNLKDIRKNKLVKPINIDLLPSEIKSIENVKKRKALFIQIILPLILDENKKIKLERKTLFSILNKNSNSEEERNWLKSKFTPIWCCK